MITQLKTGQVQTAIDSLMMGTDCLLAGHAFCVTVLALVKKHVYGLIVLVKKYSPGTS